MQRYAGKGRDTRPKWPLKWPPENCGLLRATFFHLFFKTFKNLSKQEENHLIKTLDCVHSVYYGYPRYGDTAGHKTNTQI